MNVKIKCNQCENQIDVKKGSYNYQVPVSIGNDKLFLTSVKCEKCGTLMIVQIDNYESKKLLSEVNSLIRKQISNKKKGKLPKNTEKVRKMQKHLSEIRTNLMKAYDGQVAVDENGNEIIVRFTLV